MLYIQDIFDSIVAVEQYTTHLDERKFMSNRQVQDAVMRRLEIIGEAAKHVNEDFRIKHPDIQWKQIAGMRDVLIHAYFGVNLKRVWQAVKDDLPVMKQKIGQILSEA